MSGPASRSILASLVAVLLCSGTLAASECPPRKYGLGPWTTLSYEIDETIHYALDGEQRTVSSGTELQLWILPLDRSPVGIWAARADPWPDRLWVGRAAVRGGRWDRAALDSRFLRLLFPPLPDGEPAPRWSWNDPERSETHRFEAAEPAGDGAEACRIRRRRSGIAQRLLHSEELVEVTLDGSPPLPTVLDQQSSQLLPMQAGATVRGRLVARGTIPAGRRDRWRDCLLALTRGDPPEAAAGGRCADLDPLLALWTEKPDEVYRAGVSAADDEPAHPLLGREAPDWSLEDLSGNTVSLDDFEGHVLVLDFWYMSCPHCIRSHPVINELAESYRDVEGVEVLGMNTDTDARFPAYVAYELELDFPVLLAGDLHEDYRVEGYPTFMVVDREGRITEVIDGFYEDLGPRLRSAIERARQP